jgi:hypothetical protein
MRVAATTVMAVTLGVFAGCSKSEAAPAKKVEGVGSEAVATAGKSVEGKNFKLEMKAPAACKAGEECRAVIVLDAIGEFHINKEYPYKFTANPSGDLEYLGKEDAQCPGGKNVFSKCAGDFKQEGESKATMTVRFKPTKAGTVAVNGTYKMSVCSAQNCQLESHDLSLDVTVAGK